jgi:hypothetical protein
MTNATELQAEQRKLSRLSRMLGEFEIARDLVDVYGIDTVQAAMELLLAKEARDDAGNPEDDNNSGPTTLKGALKNSTGHNNNMIIMGKNRTAVNDTRVPKKPKAFKPFEPKDNSSKSFASAASRVSSVQKSMSEAEYLNSHRNTNGSTLPWAGRQNTPRNVAGKVKIIKDACRKSREAQTEEDPYKLNHVAESYLAKKAAQSRAPKEANNTVATRSIATHPTASQSDVRARLPAAFSDGGLIPATRQENNVRDQLPNEWKDFQKTSLEKQKTGQLRTWNDAQDSLKVQPNNETSELDVEKKYGPNAPGFLKVNGMAQQEVVPPAVGGRQKDGRSIGAETYKKHPRSEPRNQPEEPTGDTGSNQESGRGYY